MTVQNVSNTTFQSEYVSISSFSAVFP